MDWLQPLITQYGLGGVILAGVAIALWKGVPPIAKYLARKIDEWQLNDQKRTDAFLAALEQQRAAYEAQLADQRASSDASLERQEARFVAEINKVLADNSAAQTQQALIYVDGQKKQTEIQNKQTDMLQQVLSMLQELMTDLRKRDAGWDGRERRLVEPS